MQFRKFLHLSDSVLHWDLCLPYNRMHICRLCLKVSGLFWCVRNSDRSLKKDTICWLSVIQFQIPHILSSVLCEIRKISVMRLLLKDAGPSSYRIHSDPQPLYEMAWFSQSQISSYWYNLYGCFPDADEASVLSAFVYVYLLFEWALLSLNFRIYGRFQPQIDPYTIAKATVSHRICHFYQCGNIISAGFHRNSSAFDYISIPGCWDVTFLFQPYPSKRRDLNPVPFTKTVFGIISYKIHFYIWSSFFYTVENHFDDEKILKKLYRHLQSNVLPIWNWLPWSRNIPDDSEDSHYSTIHWTIYRS